MLGVGTSAEGRHRPLNRPRSCWLGAALIAVVTVLVLVWSSASSLVYVLREDSDVKTQGIVVETEAATPALPLSSLEAAGPLVRIQTDVDRAAIAGIPLFSNTTSDSTTVGELNSLNASLSGIEAAHSNSLASFLGALDDGLILQKSLRHYTAAVKQRVAHVKSDVAPTQKASGSSSSSSSAGVSAFSLDVPPLYPSSLAEYHHPFGTCKVPDRRVSLEYSDAHFGDVDPASTNYTKFWPTLPDLRMLPATDHERCHFVMARMLAIISSVLKKFNMTTWFLTHATLLGAVREGGFIPWDVDVDIAMPRSHLTFLRKRWRREFPRDMFLQSEKTDTAFHMWNGKERAIRVKDRYSNFPGMRFSVQKGSKRYKQKKMHLGAHVDIIPLERKNGQYKILHTYFPAEDVFPVSTVCFENMDLPAPRNVSAFLRAIYGDDFMLPPKNATFGGPTVLPCRATQRMRGNPWSMSWYVDHVLHQPPRRWPRDDPDHGTFLTDFKTPHRLYYNNKW